MRVAVASDILEAHLNIQWLRPESALWDAIASSVLAPLSLRSPALDLGCGNGLFSFLTAGGRFSPDYDGYRNVRPNAKEGEDLHDAFVAGPRSVWIVQQPVYRFHCALDAKPKLLRQAAALGFYGETVAADANQQLPFPDETFQTVFSNMLYWLDSPESVLRDLWRILRQEGRAVLCLPDPSFLESCLSYGWKAQGSEALRLLNRGRFESVRWTASSEELEVLAACTGFAVASDVTYLAPLTLKVWDIGLRPLAPVLLKLAGRLTDPERLAIKMEWIDALRPFLQELYEMDRDYRGLGGFHCVQMEKRA